MAEIPRSQAKTINLGLFYGMGKNKLQAELGVSKDVSDSLFRQYHNRVPFVKQLMDNVMQRAQESGKIRTCWVDCVGFICGNRISLEYISHCHTIKRSWNTDQGSSVRLHTKH